MTRHPQNVDADPTHELVLLAKAIDWSRFEAVMEPAYSPDNGWCMLAWGSDGIKDGMP
ncbi:MAG: hypothetical protein IJT88_01160 [Kiritimatiellae bacterium]|nr:hypothetical protein [Kiritimatiellia bacterium]